MLADFTDERRHPFRLGDDGGEFRAAEPPLGLGIPSRRVDEGSRDPRVGFEEVGDDHVRRLLVVAQALLHHVERRMCRRFRVELAARHREGIARAGEAHDFAANGDVAARRVFRAGAGRRDRECCRRRRNVRVELAARRLRRLSLVVVGEVEHVLGGDRHHARRIRPVPFGDDVVPRPHRAKRVALIAFEHPERAAEIVGPARLDLGEEGAAGLRAVAHAIRLRGTRHPLRLILVDECLVVGEVLQRHGDPRPLAERRALGVDPRKVDPAAARRDAGERGIDVGVLAKPALVFPEAQRQGRRKEVGHVLAGLDGVVALAHPGRAKDRRAGRRAIGARALR